MTYSDPEVIEELLRNKGVYPGDPPMSRIYSYEGLSEEPLYAVFMRPEHDDMHLSPYVRNYVLLMDDGELTEAGKQWLAHRSSR